MLTVGEVARMLQIHENTVRRWSDRGILKAYRFGIRGERRFVKEEVEALIAKRTKNNNGDERIPNKMSERNAECFVEYCRITKG